MSVCAAPATRTPRHCSAANPIVTAIATGTVFPASPGTSAPTYSASTTATAAALPQVAAQSFHPTKKPA